MAMPHPTAPLRIRRFNGNTLPEYMLIAVLMLGIATTGFLVFGKSLNGSAGVIQTDFSAHKSQAMVSEASAKTQKALADAKPQKPSVMLTYNEAGQLVQTSSAFTSGANGTRMGAGKTKLSGGAFANTDNLASEQQNLLMDLANQTHQVARLEGKLKELTMFSGSDIQKFKDASVILDGKVLNASQLSKAIRDTGNDVNQKTSHVLSSGVDSATASQVAQVSSQVAQVSSQVASHASNLSQATNHVLFSNGSPWFIGGLTIPEETHEDASFICEKGHRKDNGQECQ